MSFKDDILEMTRSLPYSSYDEYKSAISLRCPFCGDSVNDMSHTHFGIKLGIDNDDLILFNCFRCGIGGILTPHVLRQIGIGDLDTNSALTKFNKSVGGSSKYKNASSNEHVKLYLPNVDINNSLVAKKHEYLERRMGRKLDIEDTIKKKVVYGLVELLKPNDITKVTCNKDQAILLQKDYVGFLSSRNEFINFRNVENNRNKRYYIYNVLGRLDNTRKFYIMPNGIDVFTKGNITINICEGVLDAFGVYYHLFDGHTENTLYVGVCGAGYQSVLEYIISMGITTNVDVNIFSDSDRQPNFYKKLIKNIKPWVNSISLYYNNIGKDYGVPKDKISLIKKRI